MKTIRAMIDNITMYRLVLYGLVGLSALGIVFSYSGILQLSGNGLMKSLIVLLAVGYATQRLCMMIWGKFANYESGLITILILFLIMAPAVKTDRILATALVAFIAILSKYLIGWRGKHIFNPAAFAAVIIGSNVLGLTFATWWVGSTVMMPFTLALSILVIIKLRRYSLVSSFLLMTLLTLIYTASRDGQAYGAAVSQLITSSPLIFFAGIMLTEPATMPSTRKQQIIFGALVGLLATLQPHFGSYRISTELALLIGNVFAFAVNSKFNDKLKLVRIEHMSEHTYNFVFNKPKDGHFLPGQYMQWTLPHRHTDSRGNRRTFTIASAPAEETIQIGVKKAEPSSSFKKALFAMKPGHTIFASQVAGTFTLPQDTSKKLVFIAGGVGITPFRSMIGSLQESKQKRDIILIYKTASVNEADYAAYFATAVKTIGLKYLHITDGRKVLSNGWLADAIETDVPDYTERQYYISGPPGMVRYAVGILRTKGVARSAIKTDYFSGY